MSFSFITAKVTSCYSEDTGSLEYLYPRTGLQHLPTDSLSAEQKQD